MRISDLITLLEKIKKTKGDLEVYLDNEKLRPTEIKIISNVFEKHPKFYKNKILKIGWRS